MSLVPPPTPTSRKPPLGTLMFVVAALYLAKEVLIPLAVAILFGFFLGPSVRRLERRGLWRSAAVVLVTSVFFSLFGVVGWIVVNQAVDLAGKLPTYQGNITRKIESLRGQGTDSLGKAARVVKDLNKKLEDTAPTAPAATVPVQPGPAGNPVAAGNTQSPQDSAPLAVRIVEPTLSPTRFISNLLGPLLGPLGTAGLVIVFTVFLLHQREDLRDRLLHLVGSERLSVTTQAVNEAGQRVSRYLLMQVIINSSYGVAVAAGLALIGVPNAILFGLLATLLRFVPYLGAWIAAAFPVLLSLAVFDSWKPLVETAAMLTLLELLICNVVEPWLYSGSTGLSPVAVIVAATFWTWLWGAVGLLLATPLTVCIVVLGRYVPKLEFLHTLLGDEPGLQSDARLYQRLLANDQEAVAELVDEKWETGTPAELYDQVLIPALNQAQLDRQAGSLDDERETFVRQTVQDLIEDLRYRHRPASAAEQQKGEAAAAGAASKTALSALPPRVIILPAKNESDEMAGSMLAHLLTLNDIGAEVLSHRQLVKEMIEAVAERGAEVVCISALRPFAVMHARYLCKRLRTGNPTLKIVIGLWDAKKEPDAARKNLQNSSADAIAATLENAAVYIQNALPRMPSAPVSVPEPRGEAPAVAA